MTAELKSYDPDYESPFTMEAREQTGQHYPGGKPDDITVIVSQVRARD